MSALFLLWCEVALGYGDMFSNWHSTEHIPTRLNILGFKSAKRYVTLNSENKFLCVYELNSPEVLITPQYISACCKPETELENRIKPHFNALAKAVTSMAGEWGQYAGALLSIACFYLPSDNYVRSVEALNYILPRFTKKTGVSGTQMMLNPQFDFLQDYNKRKQTPNVIILIYGWGTMREFERLTIILNDAIKSECKVRDIWQECYILQAAHKI